MWSLTRLNFKRNTVLPVEFGGEDGNRTGLEGFEGRYGTAFLPVRSLQTYLSNRSADASGRHYSHNVRSRPCGQTVTWLSQQGAEAGF